MMNPIRWSKSLKTFTLAIVLGSLLGAGTLKTADAAPGASEKAAPSYPAGMCYTPAGSCVLVYLVPAGSPCTCFTPWGPVAGRAG